MIEQERANVAHQVDQLGAEHAGQKAVFVSKTLSRLIRGERHRVDLPTDRSSDVMKLRCIGDGDLRTDPVPVQALLANDGTET